MPGGRPTKLTPELQTQVVQAIAAGNYMETAAQYVGVNKVSLYAWLKRGNRQKKGPYREFLNAVKKALAQAEIRDVAIISTAAMTQWQAAAWRLERKTPGKWGRRDEVKLRGKVKVNHALGQRVAADPQASELAHSLLERLAGRQPDPGRNGVAGH